MAEALMTHVFSRSEVPRQLPTVRGPKFESRLFLELMQLLRIDKLCTTAYRAATNGAVERFHRTQNYCVTVIAPVDLFGFGIP